MNFVRRFWVFGLILVMVALHAMIIMTVRRELTQIKKDESQTVDLGEYRFQHVSDKGIVYQLHLHAILNPTESLRGSKLMHQRIVIIEQLVGQQLRQAQAPWFADPTHADLKHHLKQEISKSLNIDFLEDLVVTEWLELPVDLHGRPAYSATQNVSTANTAVPAANSQEQAES